MTLELAIKIALETGFLIVDFTNSNIYRLFLSGNPYDGYDPLIEVLQDKRITSVKFIGWFQFVTNDQAFRSSMDSIANNQSITSLDISYSSIGPCNNETLYYYLMDVITTKKSLTSLRIAGNGLGDVYRAEADKKQYKALITAIAANKSLAFLDISDNDLFQQRVTIDYISHQNQATSRDKEYDDLFIRTILSLKQLRALKWDQLPIEGLGIPDSIRKAIHAGYLPRLIYREMSHASELASFPPGVLPICVAYVGTPIDHPINIGMTSFRENEEEENLHLIQREMNLVPELASFPPGVLPICTDFLKGPTNYPNTARAEEAIIISAAQAREKPRSSHRRRHRF